MKLWLRLFVATLLIAAMGAFAVHNQHTVSLSFFPLPWLIDAPLYVLLFLAAALGYAASSLRHGMSAIKSRLLHRSAQKRTQALQNELDAVRLEQQLKHGTHSH